MRIIGGEFRSRRIKPVPGYDVRPTPDRLRESLFNILAPRIEGAVFVDAYAGTGAVGIEALSRGAATAVFIEKSREAIEILEENLRTLGITARSRVIKGAAALYVGRQKADIVFIDPPYSETREYESCLAALGDAMPPLVVVQHESRYVPPESAGGIHRTRTVRQGGNTLTFYEPESED